MVRLFSRLSRDPAMVVLLRKQEPGASGNGSYTLGSRLRRSTAQSDPARARVRISARRLATLAALTALAGCQAVPRVEPPPPQAPTPTPTPPPPPPAAAPEPAQDLSWEQAPVTPGNWRYVQESGASSASFGPDLAHPRLGLACDSGARQIRLTVLGAGSSARTVTIRTSSGALQWPTAGASPAPGGGNMIEVTRPASDPGFDWIAYSRGRIAVDVPGVTRLVVPLWAEVARVIEDCRG